MTLTLETNLSRHELADRFSAILDVNSSPATLDGSIDESTISIFTTGQRAWAGLPIFTGVSTAFEGSIQTASSGSVIEGDFRSPRGLFIPMVFAGLFGLTAMVGGAFDIAEALRVGPPTSGAVVSIVFGGALVTIVSFSFAYIRRKVAEDRHQIMAVLRMLASGSGYL